MRRAFQLAGLVWTLTVLAVAAPEDRFEKEWREFRLPPFEVLAERDDQQLRTFLGELFQFRHLLHSVLPGADLRAQWPIRLWVPRQGITPEIPDTGRLPGLTDRYAVILPKDPQLTPALRAAIARTIIEDSLRPLPLWFEEGLIAILSGARIERQVLRLGQPPPATPRNLNWAKVHWLLTSKESLPTLSALAGNFEKGLEERLSLRNSFQMEPAELELAAQKVLAAGSTASVEFGGLANNPRTDFRDWFVPLGYGQLAAVSAAAISGDQTALRHSLAAARPQLPGFDVRARVQLQAIDAATALGDGNAAGAEAIFTDLVGAGTSESSWVYLEAAKLASSKAEKQRLGALALAKNARSAGIYRFLADLETDALARGKVLLEAARRDPRNQQLWEDTAAALVEGREYGLADTALEGAARSARTETERQRLRAKRWALREDRARKDEEDRRDRLASERKVIEDLRAKTMSRIDEALDRANRANESPDPPPSDVVNFADVDEPGVAEGALVRVVCRNQDNYLLEVKTVEGITRLLLRNPAAVVTEGGAQWQFQCGNQPNPPLVRATFLPKVNNSFGTIGEVLSLTTP